MKTCLIYPPQPGLREPLSYAPLGLLYVAASMQVEGMPVQVLNLAAARSLDEVRIPRADVYGITCLTATYAICRELIEQIRAQYPKARIVLGGPHPTALPEETLEESGADYVVDGEGEEVMPGIVSGKYAPGVVKAPRLYDLDRLPLPARHLLQASEVQNLTGVYGPAGVPSSTIITSRGCPYRCAFCCRIRTTEGVRYRSPQSILAELETVRREYGISQFRVLDDAFSVDRYRLMDICDLLEGRGYTFNVILRADSIQDEHIIERMKAMGVREACMGVESADPAVLKLINKRESIEEISEVIRLLKAGGIRAKVFLIEGLPGETPQSIELVKTFMTDTRPDGYTLSRFTPLPGSDIYQHPHRFGLSDIDKTLPGWFYPDEDKSDLRLWLESGVWK